MTGYGSSSFPWSGLFNGLIRRQNSFLWSSGSARNICIKTSSHEQLSGGGSGAIQPGNMPVLDIFLLADSPRGESLFVEIT